MEENRLSSISKAESDEKIGDFWDTHDFTDFDTNDRTPNSKSSAPPIRLELDEIERVELACLQTGLLFQSGEDASIEFSHDAKSSFRDLKVWC